MHVEGGEGFASCDDLHVFILEALEQGAEFGLAFDGDFRAFLDEEGDVADELDGVAETLLAEDQEVHRSRSKRGGEWARGEGETMPGSCCAFFSPSLTLPVSPSPPDPANGEPCQAGWGKPRFWPRSSLRCLRHSYSTQPSCQRPNESSARPRFQWASRWLGLMLRQVRSAASASAVLPDSWRAAPRLL